MYLNRSLCDVLNEMRTANETRNYSYLAGLIEEAQSMANRMEAALSDISDIDRLHERRKELHKEVEALRDKKGEISEKDFE